MARFRTVAAVGLALAATSPTTAFAQGSLFTTVPVELNNFVLVSAPIGKGERSQLNIYEQRTKKRPCFAVGTGVPAVVDPLLSTFDFTGICNRYIDGNGYSLRIGGDDLGTRYRLSVVNTGRDIELLATPTRNPSQPTMVVARAGGAASGFIQLKLEPGWTLRRRAYGKKSLGHLYVYRDSTAVESAPAETAPIDTPPVESAPVESANPDSTPAVTAPAEVQQVESESIDPSAADSAPVESAPADSALTPSY